MSAYKKRELSFFENHIWVGNFTPSIFNDFAEYHSLLIREFYVPGDEVAQA